MNDMFDLYQEAEEWLQDQAVQRALCHAVRREARIENRNWKKEEEEAHESVCETSSTTA